MSVETAGLSTRLRPSSTRKFTPVRVKSTYVSSAEPAAHARSVSWKNNTMPSRNTPVFTTGVTTSWERTENGYRLTVGIPANTTAEILLPDGTGRTVGAGQHRYEWK